MNELLALVSAVTGMYLALVTFRHMFVYLRQKPFVLHGSSLPFHPIELLGYLFMSAILIGYPVGYLQG